MNAHHTPAIGTAVGLRHRCRGGVRMSGLRLGAWLLAVGGLTPALPAQAASDPVCRVDISGAQIAFGTYDPLSSLPLDAAGAIDVVCDKNNVVVRVELDRGDGGSYLPRQMRSGAQTLAYNLYVDSARSSVFGDGAGGTQAGMGITSAIGGGEFRARVPVYGRIAPGLDAAFGSYSDHINVTVAF